MLLKYSSPLQLHVCETEFSSYLFNQNNKLEQTEGVTFKMFVNGILPTNFCFKKELFLPWLGGLSCWSIIPYTKRLQVQFPVRAHTRWQVQSLLKACMGGNQLVLLSLSLLTSFFSL